MHIARIGMSGNESCIVPRLQVSAGIPHIRTCEEDPPIKSRHDIDRE